MLPIVKYSLIITAAVAVLAVVLAVITGAGVGIGLITVVPILFSLGIMFLIFRKAFSTGMNPAQVAVLKASGQKTMTTFKALDRKWNVSVNGQSPIVVFTQDQNGTTYQSENLWFYGGDPALFNDPRFQAWQKLQAIDPAKQYMIPVYINPQNPQQYYMDLGDLQVQ
jgi:hypothetical protein